MWPAIRELMDQLNEAIVVMDTEDRLVFANQAASRPGAASGSPLRVLHSFASHFSNSPSVHYHSTDIPTVFCLRSAERYYFIGSSFESIFGYPPGPLYEDASAILKYCHPGDDAAIRAKIQAGPGPDPLEFEFRIIRPGGAIRWLHVCSVPLEDRAAGQLFWACFCEDITALRRPQFTLAHFAAASRPVLDGAQFDALLSAQLELRRDAAQAHHFAVAIVDIVGFRSINDRLGYEAGDRLLAEFSSRIQTKLPPPGALTRLSGDRFAILFAEVSSRSDAESRLQSVLDCLAEPYLVDGVRVTLPARCGLTFPNSPAATPASILRAAAEAHGRARQRREELLRSTGTPRPSPEIARSIELDLSLALDRGPDNDEFFFEFQPVFDPRTGGVNMLEALLRWRHPRLGLLSPSRFIAAAEDSGLVLRLDMLGLERLGRQVRAWASEIPSLADIRISINISGRHFPNFECENRFIEILRHENFRHAPIVFEITESVFVEGVPRTIDILHRLRREGVAIWLDDFGDGYSSLRYLYSFPVDGIKISEYFVRSCNTDPKARVILSSVVSLARGMGMNLVAEGVESKAQFDTLVGLGVEAIQGFYLSRPVPASDVPSLLRRLESPPFALARSA
jgi:diguanylate cyclase (GGDEF)-like protein/PAS domain S-box-containing protein